MKITLPEKKDSLNPGKDTRKKRGKEHLDRVVRELPEIERLRKRNRSGGA